MTDINIGRAQRLTAPWPFALLTSLRDDGGTNVNDDGTVDSDFTSGN